MDAAEAMVEHYHKTFELTYDMWKERNKTFLILITAIGIATLLTFKVPEANSLLVDLIAKVLGLTDSVRITQLRNSFPFGILQSILLLVVFYFMVSLYHRALYVLRYYRYLGAVENEIRVRLGLGESVISFTREGAYYWSMRPRFLGSVKWIYIILLGALLTSFLVAKVIDDIRGGNIYLSIVDVLIALATLAYFTAYAMSSIFLDSQALSVRPENDLASVGHEPPPSFSEIGAEGSGQVI